MININKKGEKLYIKMNHLLSSILVKNLAYRIVSCSLLLSMFTIEVITMYKISTSTTDTHSAVYLDEVKAYLNKKESDYNWDRAGIWSGGIEVYFYCL